ncbi:MAG: winged helix-turn-helix transcriptional regulator [Bacilli bacterium]|nr:winged helix-turn-helix transcriptional regulator [Acholeplasmataceae bacterium]
MINNLFFKPTQLYKEFILLDLISKNPNITQRTLANHLNVSVSNVNNHIDEYEKKGYLKREYLSSKTVEYLITKKGIERKNLLNLNFLKSSQLILDSAKANIIEFINKLKEKDYKKILFYGAGEVAEIMLHVIRKENPQLIEVAGIIDDDVNKQAGSIEGINIISLDKINEIEHDGILISSYAHREIMYKRLLDLGYSKDNILEFFEK